MSAVRVKRETGQPWDELEVQREPGGLRHYLCGKPIHCGEFIELQAIGFRRDDDGNDYTVPLQHGIPVRYEARFDAGELHATLHADLSGHEFVAGLERWFRFRWPVALVVLAALLGTGARAETPSDRELLPIQLDDPATSTSWTPPTTFDKVSLGVTEALIVVDVLMTLNAFRRPDRAPGGDLNPALYGDPGTARILATCGAGAVATAALWYVLPDPWRKEFTLSVGILELLNTGHMYSVGIRFSLP